MLQELHSSLDDDDDDDRDDDDKDEIHLSKLIRACWEHARRRKSGTATSTARSVTAQSRYRVKENVRGAPLIFHFYTDCGGAITVISPSRTRELCSRVKACPELRTYVRTSSSSHVTHADCRSRDEISRDTTPRLAAGVST